MSHDFSKYDILEYFGIKMAIPEQVYTPHEDTDLISEFILEWIEKFDVSKREDLKGMSIRILEIGYGPGTISFILILKLLEHKIEFFHAGTEVNPIAKEVALYNSKLNGFDKVTHFLLGNLFEPLISVELKEPYDLIVINPPYLPSEPEIINNRNVQPIDLAWDGGITGSEVIIDFLNKISQFTKRGTELIFISSSLAEQDSILDALKNIEFAVLLKKTKHIFFEDIILYYCRRK